MDLTKRLFVSASTGLLLMSSLASHAEIKTYTWTAKVLNVYDSAQVVLDAVAAGDTISGSFSVNTTATNNSASTAMASYYPVSNGDGIHISAGGISIGSRSSTPCMGVFESDSITDQYIWWAGMDCGFTATSTQNSSYLVPDYVSMNLIDNNGTALAGNLSLADVIPSPSAWNMKTVRFGNSNYSITAELVTLKPKPAVADNMIFMTPGSGVFLRGQQFDLGFGVYNAKDGTFPYVISTTLAINGVTLSDAEFANTCMWAPAGKTQALRTVLNAWICPGLSSRLPIASSNTIDATVKLSNGESHKVAVVIETL